MAKKRKDQRFVIEEDTEKQVLSLIDSAQAEALIELRSSLEKQIRQVEEALRSAPTELLANSLARGMGRRGEASFEIDPDGKMVIVVSYGGEKSDPLSRGSVKPAWTKRNERKPRDTKTVEVKKPTIVPEPDPPKVRGGFIKTSVAVSETKLLDIDSILENFDDEPEEKVESIVDDVVYENSYTPPKKRLKRIPGQSVRKGSNGKSKLSDLSSQPLDVIESSNGEAE